MRMKPLDKSSLDLLWFDADAREMRLRQLVTERLADSPPPQIDDCVVATYFLALRSTQLHQAAKDIAYHATSGIKNPPPGSLLAQCTAHAAGVDHLGRHRAGWPAAHGLSPEDAATTGRPSDQLRPTAYGGRGDHLRRVREPGRPAGVARDSRPRAADISRPGLWSVGLRKRTNFCPEEPAFGTILKPTAGITADEVGKLVAEAAECPLFLFVKEDEDLYPEPGLFARPRARAPGGGRDRAGERRSGRARD